MKVITVTANPALDVTIHASHWQRSVVNRGQTLDVNPGGKGLNVAINLNDAGIDAVVTGWMGEENDHHFTRVFAKHNVRDDFVRFAGEVRTCIKIVDDSNGETTDINMPGYEVPKHAQEALAEYLEKEVKEDTVLMFGGSLPKGIARDFYAQMVEKYRQVCQWVVVDTSGEALQEVMKAKVLPHMIKPNIHELREFCGKDLQTHTEILQQAREFINNGVEMVVVSMGRKGAWFVTKDQALHAQPPKIKVVSTVGAGDAMVAGVIRGVLLNRELDDIARRSTAYSVANIMHMGSYLPDEQQLDELKAQVVITNEEDWHNE